MKRVLLLSLLFYTAPFVSAEGEWPQLTESRWRAMTPEHLTELLASGVSVDAKDADGNTPLMHAALWSEEAEVLAVLLQAGADPHERNDFGITPLMRAVLYGPKTSILAVLLQEGAELEARDRNGRTALMHAARFAGTKTIEFLLDAGANVNVEAYGYTPLMHAAKWNEDHPEVIDVLIQAGANVNAIKEPSYEGDLDGGMTPLMFAGWNANVAVTRALLDGGADVTVRDVRGYTPLMHAAVFGDSPEAIRLLHAAGADPGATDRSGRSILHAAIGTQDNPAIIIALLEVGVDPTVQNSEGETAWDLIQENDALRNTRAYWEINDRRFQ